MLTPGGEGSRSIAREAPASREAGAFARSPTDLIRPENALSAQNTMPLSINVPDKILSGLNQSYTLTSSSGAPTGRVLVDGREVPSRVIHLGVPKTATGETPNEVKYKVSFLIPSGSVGKKLDLEFATGTEKVEASHEIIAE